VQGLAVGTIKNRMAELRLGAEKIDKQNVVARDNEHYGIGNRRHVTNVSKARELTTGDLSKITDPYAWMSLQPQAAFGLRRGESIKVRPEWADRGDDERDAPVHPEQPQRDSERVCGSVRSNWNMLRVNQLSLFAHGRRL
jgi:hypothetical protein